MKRLNMLFIAALLIISLGTGAEQVKAYGNSIITANCPNITFSITSDRPLSYEGHGRNYIVGWFKNNTTGSTKLGLFFPTRSEVVVTAVGSTYIRYHYQGVYSINDPGFPKSFVSPGDNYSFLFLDETGSLGKLSGVCTSSTITSNSTPPSGYRLMTVMCSANILSSPAGPVISISSDHTSDPMPQVGKQRYVLLVGLMGSDGQQYDKMQADAVTFGYFPRRCLA